MAGSGRLQADPLFQGLARPSMVAGVSYDYFVINAMVGMITYINTKNFLVLIVVMPIVHCVGYLLCRKEPRAVKLLMLKGAFGFKSWNNITGYHANTNSYDVF